MRFLAGLFWALSVGFAAPTLAQSEPRLALLIGNQDYPGDPPRLRRPHQDVAALAAALEAADFNVVVVLDADREAIETAVEAFAERLRAAGPTSVGFFYYAGHGAVSTAQNQRRNFMLPAGGRFESEAAVAQRGVRLDLQIDALQTGRPGTLFVVYDACRNAFTREAGGRGFAVEVPRGGLLLAMSTMADATTPDDGAYAVALAAEIERSGQSAEVAFINASRAVGASRPINQLPTVSPALSGTFCFRGCDIDGAATSSREPDPVSLATVAQRLVFDAAEAPCEYAMFVRDFPQSPLVELARRRAAGAQPCALEEEPLDERRHISDVEIQSAENIGADAPPGVVFADLRTGGGLGPEMVVVPQGTFMMGSPATETERLDFEGPQRTVTIPRAFAVGRFEVTWNEWEACVSGSGCNATGVEEVGGDYGWGRGDRPVINVDWHDAQSFARWLSTETGERYRLLTEAEWEYAARAGTRSVYPWGDVASREHANYGSDRCCTGLASGADRWLNTAPVGSFPANAFGLHDMIGNVWEWLEDCWTESYEGAPTNSQAIVDADCRYRAHRGGSWFEIPGIVRVAARNRYPPTDRGGNVGFRVARDLD